MGPQNDSDDASTWPNFPVEISEDKNTITIKPFVYSYTDENGNTNNYTYYPNMIINTNSIYGMLPMTGKIKGDIVLTRGWKQTIIVDATIDSEISRSSVAQPKATPIKSANGVEYVKKSIKPRTNFEAGAFNVKPASTTEFNKVEVKRIDAEKLAQRSLSPNFLTNSRR